MIKCAMYGLSLGLLKTTAYSFFFSVPKCPLLVSIEIKNCKHSDNPKHLSLHAGTSKCDFELSNLQSPLFHLNP